MEKDISHWRERIDETDEQLLHLLNKRAGYTLEIGKIKHGSGLAVYDPGREQFIFNRLEEKNGGPLSGQAVRRLFERIIDESRNLEKDFVTELKKK